MGIILRLLMWLLGASVVKTVMYWEHYDVAPRQMVVLILIGPVSLIIWSIIAIIFIIFD